MTFGDLKTRTLTRAGEDATAPVYYSGGDAGKAINWAQRLFVLISLCLERTASFTLTSATTFYHVRDQVTDWLLPLQVTYTGLKLRPARLADLDALDTTWPATPGDPQRYAIAGMDLLAIYKQLAAGGTLSLVYVPAPVRMSAAADEPEIPGEYQPLLVGGAIAYLRMAEGGQEFEKAKPALQALIEGAGRLGQYVRQRSLDLRYDRAPIELERFDLSRLLAIPKRRSQWLTELATRLGQAQ